MLSPFSPLDIHLRCLSPTSKLRSITTIKFAGFSQLKEIMSLDEPSYSTLKYSRRQSYFGSDHVILLVQSTREQASIEITALKFTSAIVTERDGERWFSRNALDLASIGVNFLQSQRLRYLRGPSRVDMTHATTYGFQNSTLLGTRLLYCSNRRYPSVRIQAC